MMSLPKRSLYVGLSKIIIASFFIVNSLYGFGQEKGAFRDNPSLSINFYQAHKSITAPLDVEVVLTNLTNKAFDVKSVKLILPQSLKAIRPGFEEGFEMSTHEVSGGNERVYRRGIPRVTMSLIEAIFDPETLLFIPGSYILTAEVVLTESGQELASQSLYARSNISLEPPLSAPLRGGVIGALLLALFVPAYRALSAKEEAFKELKEIVKQFLIFFIAGSVVSITAILFIYRLGSSNLPITIAVNDYLGGVIVGLFSFVFGNFLYSQFFSKEKSASRN